MPSERPRAGRIPATLQAVFLASNRGFTVNKPPPGKVANRVFFRGLFASKREASTTSNQNGHDSMTSLTAFTVTPIASEVCTVHIL
jgi:hypothetical protein